LLELREELRTAKANSTPQHQEMMSGNLRMKPLKSEFAPMKAGQFTLYYEFVI
jgi:hypothetical protein